MIFKREFFQEKRIYALTHPDFPLLPLSFINVALLHELPSTIEQIRTTSGDNQNPSHFIFYSIVSIQKGLTGIDLGNLLIKRVVELLQREFRNIKMFATLSPLPNFLNWIYSTIDKIGQDSLIPKGVLNSLSNENLKVALGTKWYQDANKISQLKTPLMYLSARYLALEKKGMFALDPVCNFHVRNGAKIEQLNWMADLSEHRLNQSAGIMVNYRYELLELEENRKNYLTTGIVPFSNQVSFWLDKSHI